MRRLITMLLIAVCAAPWPVRASTDSDSSPRTAVSDATHAAASGRRATARLVEDAGLSLTRAELPHHILKAVLVDVDADGDDDLVANTGSLDLGVWINDGSGRLTRARRVSTQAEWAPLPPSPSFDAKTTRLEVTLPDEGASAVPPPVRAGPVPHLRTSLLTRTDNRPANPPVPLSSPRAPPLA